MPQLNSSLLCSHYFFVVLNICIMSTWSIFHVEYAALTKHHATYLNCLEILRHTQIKDHVMISEYLSVFFYHIPGRSKEWGLNVCGTHLHNLYKITFWFADGQGSPQFGANTLSLNMPSSNRFRFWRKKCIMASVQTHSGMVSQVFFLDSRQQGPCNPYKPCNHSL